MVLGLFRSPWIRKQRVKNADSPLAFSFPFLFSLILGSKDSDTQILTDISLQLIIFKVPLHTCPQVCILGGSKSSHSHYKDETPYWVSMKWN